MQISSTQAPRNMVERLQKANTHHMHLSNILLTSQEVDFYVLLPPTRFQGQPIQIYHEKIICTEVRGTRERLDSWLPNTVAQLALKRRIILFC